MKSLLTGMMLILCLPLYADEPKHMVSFGRNGLGWSGAIENMETRSNSIFRGVDYLLNDLALNYAYRINSRIQLGGFYEGSHTEYKFKRKGGGSSTSSIEENRAGLFALYNFDDDINDSWYAGYSYSVTSYEEENSADFQTSEGKGPFELDNLTQSHELILGKRFSLRGFKVDNLSYSPQVRALYRSHGKDFDDQDVGRGAGFSFQPVRFDLLF